MPLHHPAPWQPWLTNGFQHTKWGLIPDITAQSLFTLPAFAKKIKKSVTTPGPVPGYQAGSNDNIGSHQNIPYFCSRKTVL